MKTSRLQSALSLLLRPSATTQRPLQIRCAHQEASKTPIIPSPTPFVPDVKTFLTLIGRGLSQHAAKFPTWEALFSLTSPQLQELGIEPPRTRRYLIQWREKFIRGHFGVGGDIKHVNNGVAELRVVEVPLPEGHANLNPLARKRFVVNVPAGMELEEVDSHQRVRVVGYTTRKGRGIIGPYALPTLGGLGAKVTITEGMWEDKRGRKVDGGERRQAEVRFKKRVAERKAEKERRGFL